MSLKDLIANGRPISVSFEFSPPKTEEAEASLWSAIKRLERAGAVVERGALPAFDAIARLGQHKIIVVDFPGDEEKKWQRTFQELFRPR